MPITITKSIELYKFEEFDESDQQKILDANREVEVDHDWWDFVYEDATAIAALFGVTIERIYFRGFWSQGDGACFEGDFEYKPGCLKAVKEYAGQDEELHSIVEQYVATQKQFFYKLYGSVKQSGYYMHEYCTDFTVYDERTGQWGANEEAYSGITDALRSYMRWIYKRLEAEYEYLTSDEYVKERLIENGARFTSDGEIYDWEGWG